MTTRGQQRRPPAGFRVIAPDPQVHRDGLIDLVAKVFSGGGYFNMVAECRRGYIDHRPYDWGVSRIGMAGERIVTHFGVWDYMMRIGSARVRTGGIGAVATHPDYRQRGLMARTVEASLAAMRDAGYHFTLLFGIAGFYDRFGYCRAWSDTRHTVATADLPTDRPAGRVRKVRGRLSEAMIALYNRQHAGATGTAVRPVFRGDYHRRWTIHQWLDRGGRLSGYVIVRPHGETLECAEVCGDAEEALRVLGRVGRRERCRDVRLSTVPFDSEVCRRLRRGNCRTETRYQRSGGAMIRTVNLPAALGCMAGELSRRLKGSAMARWRGRVRIADAWDAATLAIDRTRVRVEPPAPSRHAIRGGAEIARLLIGSQPPGEVVAGGDIRLSGAARELVGVLFGPQHPTLSAWDGY